MPAFITVIMGIFGMVAQAMPTIEKLADGFLTFISTEFAKIFGPGDAANKVQSAMDQAEALIHSLDVGTVDTVKWVTDMVSSIGKDPTIAEIIAELEKLWPGITKGIYAAHNIAGDHGVGFGPALAVVVSQHAAVRTGKTATP